MKSILQTEKKCYITGSKIGLHKHHIYMGYNRKKSEMYGFWVWLRYDWHNGASYGVHNSHTLDMRLKRECQRKFEQNNTREEFLKIIGRSYL